MTFQEHSKLSREKIKKRLIDYCESKKSEDLPSIFKEQGLIDSLTDFVLRGKLIRGSLFLLISESFGNEVDDKLIGVAVAIELMHSALLIQDDIIDNDYTRRGARTVFAHYQEEGKRINAFDAYHYGISTAIVVADVAYFFAMDLISQSRSDSLAKLMQYYAHEVYLVAVAESADSLFGQTNIEPSKDDIYAVYKYKTARYTFSLPFEMASIVANASDKTRAQLSEIGEHAGIIFQLKDDEIGLFGEEQLIGKPVGSDIRENKKTIIRHILFEKADPSDKKTLDSIFGNPHSGQNEIDLVKIFYEKYKVHDFIKHEIENRMHKIWETFENLNIQNEQKLILKSLLEFNINRSY